MRQLSVEMPKSIVELVGRRASINGRSRTAEFRYLVDLGLGYSENSDPRVDIQPKSDVPWTNVNVSLTPAMDDALSHRSQTYHRGLGREFLRMTVYALEETARKDLEVIEAMIQLQGSEQPSAQ